MIDLDIRVSSSSTPRRCFYAEVWYANDDFINALPKEWFYYDKFLPGEVCTTLGKFKEFLLNLSVLPIVEECEDGGITQDTSYQVSYLLTHLARLSDDCDVDIQPI